MFINPDTDVIADLLKKTKTIAVLGLSPKPGRDSYRVAADLQRFGYRIVPVRPNAESILGEKAYPSLSAIPKTLLSEIDLVNVFRAPEHVPEIVDECLQLGVRALWLQLGIVHEAAAARAVEGGMTVVMDRCTYVDYLRLVDENS
jgi:hypothetical protein